MSSKKSIIFALFGALLFLSQGVQANPRSSKRIAWTEKRSNTTGLYTTKSYFVTQGVSFGFNAMYYYGDVDNMGVAFNGGFNKENLSYGGSLAIAYHMPISSSCALRFSLLGGTLHGNNKAKFEALNPPRYDFRQFKSVFAQPSVGVEYYPIDRYGFFLYGGLGLTASYIYSYEFYYRPERGADLDIVSGKTWGILPMVQLGLGYSWNISPSWMITAEVLVQEGLIDTHYLNLDAFPLDPSQNSKEVSIGQTFGTWKDAEGNEHIHWNDGWFQVGITVTYRWSNCESCRLLNNYSRLKPSRWQ